MCAGTGGGGVRAGLSETHTPLSFCSEDPDGLQKFQVVRAAAQAPEDVGPRESGEPPSLRGPLAMSRPEYSRGDYFVQAVTVERVPRVERSNVSAE